jgi:CDP-glucose 4,6-dehydratase
MPFNNIYKNRSVLITGHTGFKGSWLAVWLTKLGSNLCGYSLDVPTIPSHFSLLDPAVRDTRGDVADFETLRKTIQQFEPEIVFHLAAQSLVRPSFQKPLETFSTNILGTANVLEACRQTSSVRAVVVITSDKCYKNTEPNRGYNENDALGGDDPYSASKACAEIVTESYRKSFADEKLLIATCRAGNVIGGGDWAADRLMPDLMRSAAGGEIACIRMPNATRPWQHVLNPISGYLLLGQVLMEGRKEFAEAWNFGPDLNENLSVDKIVKLTQNCWKKIKCETVPEKNCRETPVLMLDCNKTRQKLGWKSVWSLQEGIEQTVSWYRNFYENNVIQTLEQINEFEKNCDFSMR